MGLLINKIIVFAFFSASLFFVGAAMAGECLPKEDDATMTEFCEAGDTPSSCVDLEVCEWDDS